MDQTTDSPQTQTLTQTPLFALHEAAGATFAPFAGYEMPVRYAGGILAEHIHTRQKAGLFDVCHMGQVRLTGAGAVAALESLVPADIEKLAPGQMQYTMFTTDNGGIIDDLIVTREAGGLFLVINAGCKDRDIAHLKAHLSSSDGGVADLEVLDDCAMLALQGPAAAAVIAEIAPGAADLPFMAADSFDVAGIKVGISRSGYTGEDGFEITCNADEAQALAERLLAHADVAWVGLGARDSLRLEAGLCLYGHDIGLDTTPVEAALGWTISKRRRSGGSFPGADIILRQFEDGPSRRRVGILPDGRAPAREGTEILDATGAPVGTITSGGFGPTVGGPVAMGYVDTAHAAVDTPLQLMVRDTPRPAKVAALPFVPHRYRRSKT